MGHFRGFPSPLCFYTECKKGNESLKFLYAVHFQSKLFVLFQNVSSAVNTSLFPPQRCQSRYSVMLTVSGIKSNHQSVKYSWAHDRTSVVCGESCKLIIWRKRNISIYLLLRIFVNQHFFFSPHVSYYMFKHFILWTAMHVFTTVWWVQARASTPVWDV